MPQRQFGEYAPTCLELYKQYPSGVGDGTVVTDDQQSDAN
jgi:hypothetical protein